jgi:outer membrane murein-binding lipoprotein Lpp
LRHFSNGTVAKRRHSLVGAVVLAAVLVGGCASTTGGAGLGPDTPADVKKDAVTTRAKARWDALINRDVAGAYAFMSPASRATMPLDLYKAKHKVGLYRSVKVDGVNCETDKCTVNLSVTYDYKRFKGMTTPLVEKWIIAEGQAWFVE